jgi:hypothetical protein
MSSNCRLVGWMDGWLLEKGVENFQTNKTTGAYCAPVLVLRKTGWG